MILKNRCITSVWGCCAVACSLLVHADEQWQYGGYIDMAYAQAFQTDDSLEWRSKATTQRLNQFSPNMGMFYVRKLAAESSRWGMEVGAQAGYDTDGQVPAQQRLAGYSILRYLNKANLSYLAPVGSGLKLTAGLMNSFIGFESLFAKDNPNYTRSWMADYSPYYLMGVAAEYSPNSQLDVGLYVVNDYDYLAYRNDQPKYGAQLRWSVDDQWQLTQNLFAGPEQAATDTPFWRYFSDTVLQWSSSDVLLALAYDVGTERRESSDRKQTLWMGSALFSRWHIEGPWSVALRPELYWDADGQMTGSEQFIKAVTATLEYKIPLAASTAIALRTEYRYDDSGGRQGGFFKTGQLTELTGTQHLLLFSCLLTLDNP